jgi:hypothetical protein
LLRLRMRSRSWPSSRIFWTEIFRMLCPRRRPLLATTFISRVAARSSILLAAPQCHVSVIVTAELSKPSMHRCAGWTTVLLYSLGQISPRMRQRFSSKGQGTRCPRCSSATQVRVPLSLIYLAPWLIPCAIRFRSNRRRLENGHAIFSRDRPAAVSFYC